MDTHINITLISIKHTVILQLTDDTKDIIKLFLKRFKVKNRFNPTVHCQLRDAISEPQVGVLNMRL